RPDRRETSRRAPFEAGAPEPLEHAVHVLQHATHQGEGAHSPETERSERHAWRASLQATSSLLLSTLARSLVGLRFRAALARLLTGSLRSFDVPLSHDCLRQTAPAPQGRRKLTTQETRCLSRPCEIANGHAGAPGATPPTIRERLIGQRHCCSRRARTLLTAHRERRSVAARPSVPSHHDWTSTP